MLPADLYARAREKEGRLYPDELAVRLPEVPLEHPLHAEWMARAASLSRLLAHLRALRRTKRILDVGCGNGWLSRHLPRLPDAQVWGLDLHSPELVQASRLFGSHDLVFITADIFRVPFPERSFDLIILASVIQYFPDLRALIRTLQGLLTQGGRLHILDSPLYKETDLEDARERTRRYYASLGVPQMAEHYFHHRFSELQEFQPRWHYRPDSLRAKLARRTGHIDSPFPWLSISP